MKKSLMQMAGWLALSLWSCLALAAATIQSVTGSAQVANAQGVTEPLAVGQRILPGSTLKTGLNSAATLRFDDGQLIALTGSTTFTLDEFKFNPHKPEEGGFLSTLVKGGLRAVSGLIGEKNPKDVKFKTVVATVGIRGTDFDLFYDGRLYVSVKLGAIAVNNGGGEMIFRANQQPYGIVVDQHTIPKAADPVTFPAEIKGSFRQNAANPALGAKPADPKDPTCSDRR